MARSSLHSDNHSQSGPVTNGTHTSSGEVTMSSSPHPILTASGLTVRYPGTGHAVVASFDLELHPREIVSILGQSGAGKSSVLRLLSGIEKPAGGEIRMNGMPLGAAHPRVAIGFQDPALLPWLSLEK